MRIKIILTILVFLGVDYCYAQKEISTRLGKVSRADVTLSAYEKDSTASAVVIYEHANYYMDEARNYKKTTDYYFKVKILSKEGFPHATVKIPLYGKEKVHSIKGITYNLNSMDAVESVNLEKTSIYTTDSSEDWKKVTFTMPKVRVGSVIEYVYSITTPYSQIDDWEFQGEIPKIKSVFTASILGNWKYNIIARGFLELATQDTEIKKKCINIPHLGIGDCVNYHFSMEDIPAFKEEDFMLSADNFKAKIEFDLESFTAPSGEITKYTTTWKAADEKLKSDFLDNQVSKNRFFKKRLPESIFEEGDLLSRAKSVHEYIQTYFSWNGKFWPSKKVRLKKAFDQKTGNVFDINLSLYNALRSADIEAYLVLSATRDRALPSKLNPIVNDFNYVFVKVIVDNKVYYLDATNKNFPFGLVRFKALNGDGRVLDFDRGSYWEDIVTNIASLESFTAKLRLTEEGIVEGKLTVQSDGYYALNKRVELQTDGKEKFVADFEEGVPNMEILNSKIVNAAKPESVFKEHYEVEIENPNDTDVFTINPFLFDRWPSNPFKLEKREYPVDFGYTTAHKYLFSLTIPEGYKVSNSLENIAIGLPYNGGRFIVNYLLKDNVITIYSKIHFDKSLYSSEEYFYLKEFFKRIVKTHELELKIVPVS